MLRYQGMDDPGTLRRKAARCFDKAASSPTTNEAKKLNEVGCQLELWADELEENGHSPKRNQYGRGLCLRYSPYVRESDGEKHDHPDRE